MTREEARGLLMRCEAESYCPHYLQKFNCDGCKQRIALDMAIEALSGRPTDEWCTDCKEYDHEKHCCPRFNRVIRTTLNEAVANLKEELESAIPNCQKCAIKELWKETEKEDLVSVVRCKDCRHRDLFSCPLADNDFQKDEDFCSWGERREP